MGSSLRGPLPASSTPETCRYPVSLEEGGVFHRREFTACAFRAAEERCSIVAMEDFQADVIAAGKWAQVTGDNTLSLPASGRHFNAIWFKRLCRVGPFRLSPPALDFYHSSTGLVHRAERSARMPVSTRSWLTS